MNNPKAPPVIYLDQDFLSHLRHGQIQLPRAEGVVERLNTLIESEFGLAPVYAYSDVHVTEVHKASRKAEYIQALQRIGACHVSFDGKLTCGDGRIQADFDESSAATLAALRVLDALSASLLPLIGFLPPSAVSFIESLQREAFDAFFDRLDVETEGLASSLIPALRAEIRRTIRDTLNNISTHEPIDKVYHANALPNSIAELLARKPDAERNSVQAIFPENFMARIPKRVGDLAGLCLYASIGGIIQTGPFHKQDSMKSVKNFANQWRDCCHIEAASQCQILVTCDKDSSRIAKAVYAYAGSATQVLIV